VITVTPYHIWEYREQLIRGSANQNSINIFGSQTFNQKLAHKSTGPCDNYIHVRSPYIEIFGV